MYTALLSLASLLLGQFVGYRLALSGTRQRIAAEKRAEYVSHFIGLAYHNLRFLVTRELAERAGEAVPELAVLGDQAAFFVSDQAAEAIDNLTRAFSTAVAERADPEPGKGSKVFDEYKTKLDDMRRLLRRDLKAAP